ncbi:HAD family hydrolase [Brucepastera parasyntrophica]|uniref:HAD family hydrolase n=1 Tax=Brucepastera parasyntrophica TaxID=2880008 RepID=UPI00210A12D7|nr:HAD family hydrolase [Brucepastera parasyntrophica]ULQ59500.1 HAD family hydrolase [Brucepastera parasyntrophica]
MKPNISQIPKAVLFDLDDTLISFEDVSGHAWRKSCGDFTEDYDLDFSAEELFEKVHETRNWYWNDADRHLAGRKDLKKARREITALALNHFGVSDEKLVNELADNFSAYKDTLLCVFPGSIETLSVLKNKGFRLGLVSNGTTGEQRAKLGRFNLAGFFEVILIEGEVGYGKPDVRIFEKALQMLRLRPEEVWMVGDNLVWDIETPQKLGIFSVWNDYAKKGLPEISSAVPDAIISNVVELLPLLIPRPNK